MPARSLCAVPADRIHPLQPDTRAQQCDPRASTVSNLTIAALGVVYGDIGTSPLYAVRQSLVDFGDLSEPAVLGALSLIVWALVLVVTVKYVLVIMRADNRGEGGLLALTALVLRSTNRGSKRYLWIMAAGLVGAALFYGDGVDHPRDFRAQRRRRAESCHPTLRTLCAADLRRSPNRLVSRAAARDGGRRRPLRAGDAGLVWRARAARHMGDRAASSYPHGTQPD